ncbi:MAG TPA: BLUF domain-containing protein [Chryseosolibacter sp.]
MLSHLIYISSRTPQCTEAEIEKILVACQKNNPALGVTGVLLYSPTTFVQYIEGDYKNLSALYDKIKLDNRHKSTMMISSAPIKERSFPSWHMGTKKLDLQSVDFRTQITEKERTILNEVLEGKKQDSQRAIELIKKFFK